MRKECSIVRDLLPLYVEDMVSADTGEFVKEHLEGCEECRKEYERMKQPQTQEQSKEEEKNMGDAVPLVTLKRKLWQKKVQTVLCTGLFVIVLLVSAFAVMSAPEYFSYSEDLFTITENEDESITITFDEKVTDYRCEADAYRGSDEGSFVGAGQCYQIEAWTSLWNTRFSKRGVQSTTIRAEDKELLSVYYLSNNGTEDTCIYGQPITSGGVITLPRLVLSYYLLLALLCIVVLFVIRCVVMRKPKIKVWVDRILWYLISYCIGHLIVAGFGSGSYSAQRDFMWIVFLSIVIYGGLLLARNVYRVRKEIRELTNKS